MPPNLVPRGIFLGIGDALLDMSAPVDEEFFARYDIEKTRATLAEERHLRLFKELVAGYEPKLGAGGSVLNTVRAAQWMMGSPGATSFLGTIGTDSYGEVLKEAVAADGVNAHFSEEASRSTGTSASLLSAEGEKAFVANLGCSDKVTLGHLQSEGALELVENSKFIYANGVLIVENYEALMQIARLATNENKIFLFNVSASHVVEYFEEELQSVLAYSDFLFANESEAAAIGRLKGWGKDVVEIALRLSGLPKASGTRPRVVVVTQGSRPTIVATTGEASEYPVEQLPNELIVDINGVGDAFVGGFVAKLVQGEKLGNCVRAGHWVSRTVIQRYGCTFPKECSYA